MPGATIALGSRGAGSADNQNLFETIKGAEIVHRIAHDQSEWILAQDALAMCWHGRAASLRQPIGRIKPGLWAGLTFLDRRSVFLAPRKQLMGQLVHSELGASVESVMVAGEIVLDKRRLIRIDKAAIHAEAQEIVLRLYEGLPSECASSPCAR